MTVARSGVGMRSPRWVQQIIRDVVVEELTRRHLADVADKYIAGLMSAIKGRGSALPEGSGADS